MLSPVTLSPIFPPTTILSQECVKKRSPLLLFLLCVITLPTPPTSQSADDFTHYPSRLQLLICSLPVSNTIVIQVNDSDSIAAVHEKINSVTRVPVDVQRLIYEGRQLYHEQSLRECRVKSGANLQLVARLRSAKHPQICILVNDMVSHIFHLCRGGQPRSDSVTIKSLLSNFIFSTSAEDRELSGGQLQIFLSASVPAALKMDACLKIIEDHMNGGSDKHLFLDWWQFRNYLTILKELNNISKLYTGAEETFWLHMKQKESAISFLIVRCARRTEDHEWILEHKEVTNFEARSHLALMLLLEMSDDYEELHEMLIYRTNLLVESFEYIAHAKSSSLHGELLIEFKNEEATGPGVLREWFSLVFQAIFNAQNALFVACPNDLRRFLPNPSSKVDPMHLEYFNFAGRMTALALMHKMQVGIMLDRTLFMVLAGKSVSLEDIKVADPFFYTSCMKILEMEAEIVDKEF